MFNWLLITVDINVFFSFICLILLITVDVGVCFSFYMFKIVDLEGFSKIMHHLGVDCERDAADRLFNVLSLGKMTCV